MADIVYQNPYFSKCRLCASENSDGIPIFSDDNVINDISSLINKYLPLKVHNDDKLPKTICSSCNVQLHSTINYFNKIRDGQKTLRILSNLVEKKEESALTSELQISDGLDGRSPELMETEKLCVEDSLQIDALNESELPLKADHSSIFETQSSSVPKKRGRPPKDKSINKNTTSNSSEKNSVGLETLTQEENGEDPLSNFRVKRKRQVPLRYQEAVQGKELEQMFKEETGAGSEDDKQPEEGDNNDDSHLALSGLEDEKTDAGSDKTSQGCAALHKKIRKSGNKRQKQVFVCDICGKGFLLKSKLLEHKNTHESSVFECKNCSDVFLKKESYDLHVSLNPQCAQVVENSDIKNNADSEQPLEIKRQDFFCSLCNKAFKHEPRMALHVQAEHENTKPFICDVCNKGFSTVISLKTHMIHIHKRKNQKGYPCEICGKLFNYPSSAVYHREAEHTTLEFNCDKCGRSFKHKQLLMRHQLVHTDLRPFVCKSCGATFKTKPNLMNHQATHTGEKKHVCEICGQQFAHKTSLKLHYRWHAGQKPFKCDTCEKTFSQKGNLQEHKRIHTGEKPFACSFCDRKFTTSSQYKLHVKRHVGDRPWQCEVCPKTFLHRDTWKCHMRRHRGEKPFSCTFCCRDFSEQWALKKHVRLHTGEKPYSCDICFKTFSDCSNLTKHKKVHEKLPRTKKEDKISMSVWKLIKDHLEIQMNQNKNVSVSPGKEDDVEQIIYVTYDDSNSVAAATSRTTNNESLLLTADNLGEVGTTPLLGGGSTKAIQMTDEMGNPVNFTMLNGGELQLTSGEGGETLQVVTQDGRAIPVEITNIDSQTSDTPELTLQLTPELSTDLANLNSATISPVPPTKSKRTKTNSTQSSLVNLSQSNVTPAPNSLLTQQIRNSVLKKYSVNFNSESTSLLTANSVQSTNSLLSKEPDSEVLSVNNQKGTNPSIFQNITRNLSSSKSLSSKQPSIDSFELDSAGNILLTHADGTTSLLQSSTLVDKGSKDSEINLDELESQQSIEFTVEGQKLRMMTPYNLVPIQIPIEYLNMNE